MDGLWRIPIAPVIPTPLLPQEYMLNQNFPNPFNTSTIISFSVPQESFVTIKVFNVMGQEVATVVSEEMAPGEYARTWDAGMFSSGVYFYRLQSGNYSETKRLLLLK